ncbi:unnamed protein product [Blepharisma stoltei]|uniref:Uncharacterized protein n=1 Tax=Blepharisma stoltei TaxID=1481888 RepID=A0AAU9JQ64_9CILI|nr:unnamed protein product [Blepharisma stoltei]
MAVLHTLACLNYKIKVLFYDEFMKRWSKWRFGDLNYYFTENQQYIQLVNLVKGKNTFCMEIDLKRKKFYWF